MPDSPQEAAAPAIVDLLRLEAEPVAGREHQRLLSACSEDGSFRLTGTGLESQINDVYERSAAFHDLRAVDKAPIHNDLHRGRGWVPLLTEPAYEAGTVARCESFDLAKEIEMAEDRDARGILGPNAWPDVALVGDFQPTVYGFYEAMRSVSRRLLAAMALALGLERDRLCVLDTDQSPSMMRLLHYPGRPVADHQPSSGLPVAAQEAAEGELVGISTHTDYELVTLMHQNGSGLELQRPDGRWVEAPVNRLEVESVDFTVIIGDMLERLTNGTLVATPHRVPDSDVERSSIILFCAADAHTPISPFPEFVTRDRPVRYEPTTQAAHLAAEVGAAMDNRDVTSGPSTRS